jgi:hypothetical protein
LYFLLNYFNRGANIYKKIHNVKGLADNFIKTRSKTATKTFSQHRLSLAWVLPAGFFLLFGEAIGAVTAGITAAIATLEQVLGREHHQSPLKVKILALF